MNSVTFKIIFIPSVNFKLQFKKFHCSSNLTTQFIALLINKQNPQVVIFLYNFELKIEASFWKVNFFNNFSVLRCFNSQWFILLKYSCHKYSPSNCQLKNRCLEACPSNCPYSNRILHFQILHNISSKNCSRNIGLNQNRI